MLLARLDGLSGNRAEHPYVAVSRDALPRAFDYLNVA
jgi:hypothetical protein